MGPAYSRCITSACSLVYKALSQTIVPLVFPATKWTGIRLTISQDGHLRLSDLLRDSQDPDPGLLAQDTASYVLTLRGVSSLGTCVQNLGLVYLLLLSPAPSRTMGSRWGGLDPHPLLGMVPLYCLWTRGGGVGFELGQPWL